MKAPVTEGLQIPRPDWSAEAKLHFVERVCILRRLKYKLIVRYPNFYELTLRSATKTASNVADSDKIAGPATKSALNVADRQFGFFCGMCYICNL